MSNAFSPLGSDEALTLVREATVHASKSSHITVSSEAGRAIVATSASQRFVPWGESEPCAFAIGAFDGVHLGHRVLVDTCVRHARERGVLSAAILFDPDPTRVLAPASPEPELLSVGDRALLLLSLGLDAVVILRFDRGVAATPYEEFVTRDLAAIAPIESIHVGNDFRLGAGGAGDVAHLGELGRASGFAVYGRDLVDHGGAPVTATRIRALLASGDVRGATDLLGRCHVVHGTVAHGRGEGTGLGFPTANVIPSPYACLPADGVYGCFVRMGECAWPAAVNVGRPRSFAMPAGSPERLLEANLIGFSQDIYGCGVEVVFVEWLRAPRTFPSISELERVVGDNVAWVRENLGTSRMEVGT